MLESLIRPKTAEKDPKEIFFIAILFSFIGVAFAEYIFPTQSSVFTVALVTMLFLPLFQRLFEIEEKKDYKLHNNLFKRHEELFIVFGAFFLGVIVAMSFIYTFFHGMRGAFVLQEGWYTANGLMTGQALGNSSFWTYFVNNSQVMLMMFLLSVIFGAGAIFILTWNASIIAVYVGFVINSFIRTGISPELAYFIGVPAGIGSIALHGVPEIGAYILGALAGGMLSVGVIREQFKGHFEQIFIDSVIFLCAAEALIVLAAVLEAFI
jgi:uncharacterized membrane protein SpoIIM required for sporulation